MAQGMIVIALNLKKLYPVELNAVSDEVGHHWRLPSSRFWSSVPPALLTKPYMARQQGFLQN